MDLFGLALTMVLGFQDPTPPPPPPPAADITFPGVTPAPKPPKPPEPPIPGPVPIRADSFYVITSTNQFLTIAEPEGKVKISRTKGPITLFGRFADAPDEVQMREFKQPYVTIVTAVSPGQCTLVVWPTRAVTEEEVLRRQLDVNVLPIPPPIPPDPTPTPTPTPTPSPAPIPEAGNRVLIVFESGDVSRYPQAQANIMTSQTVRDFLNRKCAQGPKNKEWRIWDKDVPTGGESVIWQKAMTRPRTSYPWLIVSNGQTGYEGPLPANVQEMMTLLQKYFGS